MDYHLRQDIRGLLQASKKEVQMSEVHKTIHTLADIVWQYLPPKVTEKGYIHYCEGLERYLKTLTFLPGDRFLGEYHASFLVRAAAADVMSGSELIDLERTFLRHWKLNETELTLFCDGRNELVQRIEDILNQIW